MSSSDGNIYIDGLTAGDELSPFKLVADSPTNPTTSIITPNTAKAGYVPDITSFVVGSDRLDDDSSVETKNNRMFFEKSTGAFRAGTTASTQWDNTTANPNRGTNSAAFGDNNIARGANSFAVGSSNTASGPNAIALGLSNQSTSFNTSTVSVAIGNSNTVTLNSQNSVAIGNTNTTGNGNNVVLVGANNTSGAGNKSYAFGNYNNVIGTNSFAIGYGDSPSSQNTAESIGSIAIGHNNRSTGADSVAIGEYCTASGANSVSIGYGTSLIKNTAGNTGSVSIGYQNDSTGVNSVAIGSNNAATGNSSFAIGSGCNTNAITGSICMGSKAFIDIDTTGPNNTFFWNGDVDTNGYVAPHKYGNNHYVVDNFQSIATGGGICFWGGRSGEFRIGFGNNLALDNYASQTNANLLTSTIRNGILYQAGASSWSILSDINKKENLIEHDYEYTLDKIMEMPVYTYNFISYGQKNIGPVAQDFNRLFPSDSDPLMISSGNLAGVTLAGVKGVKLGLDNLSDNVNTRFASNSDATSALQSRIAVLESSLATASAQIAGMEGRLAALEL